MFLTRLEVEDGPGPDLWTVRAPLIWDSADYGRLEVPIGFVTDLASIPRLFRNLPFLDPNGLSRRPAVLHDYLYGSVIGRKTGKQFADCFLREALLREGCSKASAETFYLAVHWFGGSAWRSDAAKAV